MGVMLRDALNNTVGSGKYTNYRSGSSYDYRENRSWDFQKDGKKNRSTGEDHGTGYQGYADAKGNDSRNGNFQRNGTGRQDTNHQNSDLALYLPTNGIKVGGILKTVFGGITTGVFGILTLIVGGVAILKGGGFWVGAGSFGCNYCQLVEPSRPGLQQSYQFKPPKQVYQGSWHSHLLQFPAAGTGSRQAGEICKKRYQTYDKQRLVPSGTC